MTVLEQIKQLSQSLSEDQRRSLAAFLSSREGDANRQPRNLYGIWKGAFPADFDVDAELDEIRAEWQKEIQEIAP
jgi:hypothetical protein